MGQDTNKANVNPFANAVKYDWHKPKRGLLIVWRMYLIAASAIPALLLSLFLPPLVNPLGIWRSVPTLIWIIAFVGLYSIYLPLLYRHKAFRVERDRITSSGGVIYRYTNSLPIKSIQYVSLIAGPAERVLRICTVAIVAPGGRMLLSGLGRTDGERLLEVLTEAAMEGK